MQKKPTKFQWQFGTRLLLISSAAVTIFGTTAFSTETTLVPGVQPFANAVLANPQAIKNRHFAEGASPCSPCSPSEAATKVCFDLDVGRPVPCHAKHTEEAEPDGRDFMAPHSGPRDGAK